MLLRLYIAVLGSLCSSPSVGYAADIEHGKIVFKQCEGCHSVVPGEHRFGPSLAGVVGRAAGSLKGYEFSDALTKVKFRWTAAGLSEWVSDEAKNKVPGTRMEFPGLPNPTDVNDLVAYLATLKAK